MSMASSSAVCINGALRRVSLRTVFWETNLFLRGSAGFTPAVALQLQHVFEGVPGSRAGGD